MMFINFLSNTLIGYVMAVITIPEVIVRLLRRKAEEKGMSIDEYLMDILTNELEPKARAHEYIQAALEILEQARDELKKENLRQASEKIWGAAALALKAHAYARMGKRITSHRELWEYKSRVAKELGDWVLDAWMYANAMHVNFYEGWADKLSVEKALERVEKLVKAIANKLGK